MTRFAPTLLLLAAACADVEGTSDVGGEQEVITTVVLTFGPTGGGAAREFAWADPENDGDPVVDTITLDDAVDYGLTVAFRNELEDPAEEITPEIEDERDEHQIFVTGSAVQGPATGPNPAAVLEHVYADVDANDLPVGLDNTVTALGVGEGELTVTLRHLPPESGRAVKTEDLASDVAAGGFGAIGGDTDVQVSFDVEVR